MRGWFAIIAFLLISAFLKAAQPGIIFKENKGQWPEKVLFGTEVFNTKFYVNKNSFNYCVYNPEEYAKTLGKPTQDGKLLNVHGHNYEVTFENGDLTSFTTKNNLTEYYNYFLGNNPSKWANNVKASKTLEFYEIYEGINLLVYSNSLNLKYDFIISPRANPNQIKLHYDFVDGIEIRNKELIIKTSVGEIVEKAPLTYQIINGDKININCEYVLLSNNTISFRFPNGYNKKYELVIDPVVVACSYSGSSVGGYNVSCTYDANGNIYNYGGAEVGYPVTLGAFQTAIKNMYDNYISVFNSSGSSKIFSTYIGGDTTEWPIEILVKNNEIVLFGFTDSQNFPHSANAFDTLIGGKTDFFVTKLNMSGSALIASTYIGGSGTEPLSQLKSGFELISAGEMVLDGIGNVYVISCTNSSDFPVTAGAFLNTKSGINDACVFKLDNSLSNLVWSTYLGGSNSDDGKGIRLDGSGGVYCFGTTNSTNFPTTPGAFQTNKTGVGVTMDFFVSHLNSNGTSLIASTYIGTIGNDRAALMDVDQNNDVYLTGFFSSTSQLTVTPGVYNNAGGINSLYKLNSTLNNIIFKTKYGTTSSGNYPHLVVTALKVDSCQNIYVAGFSYNSQSTTPNQLQPFAGGYTDLYMAVFGKDCSSLKFGSFYGGNSTPPTGYTLVDEQIGGICQFDNRGTLYLAINSTMNLPTTSNAYAPLALNSTTVPSIYNDAFLKVDLQTFVNSNSSYGANVIGCQPFSANFISTTNLGTTYWDLGDGTTSFSGTISHTYTNIGTYNVLLVVTDTATCNKTDSIKSIVNVITPTVFDLGEDVVTCINTPLVLKPNTTGLSYYWNNGQTTSSISVTQPGNYTLILYNGGCNTSDDVNVIVAEKRLSERFPNVVTPNADGVNDIIDFRNYNFDEIDFTLYDRWGREKYKITSASEQWSPSDLNNGTYFYVVTYKSNCTGESLKDKGIISVFK